ncbi:hypothetical protein I4F81_001873 [Pyropia yezoensis]|uniref:Uncharacterized protein n=1 Tax=Pyropia yezoensis TaxID=2788 RepID=A0ACC3BMT4_PYRYE|nr:hypothetical protein I4F81_001873 [Neopyropia yezoensis]
MPCDVKHRLLAIPVGAVELCGRRDGRPRQAPRSCPFAAQKSALASAAFTASGQGPLHTSDPVRPPPEAPTPPPKLPPWTKSVSATTPPRAGARAQSSGAPTTPQHRRRGGVYTRRCPWCCRPLRQLQHGGGNRQEGMVLVASVGVAAASLAGVAGGVVGRSGGQGVPTSRRGRNCASTVAACPRTAWRSKVALLATSPPPRRATRSSRLAGASRGPATRQAVRGQVVSIRNGDRISRSQGSVVSPTAGGVCKTGEARHGRRVPLPLPRDCPTAAAIRCPDEN